MNMYAYIYPHTHTHIMCVCVYTYVCMYKAIYAYIYAMCVCIYVCLCAKCPLDSFFIPLSASTFSLGLFICTSLLRKINAKEDCQHFIVNINKLHKTFYKYTLIYTQTRTTSHSTTKKRKYILYTHEPGHRFWDARTVPRVTPVIEIVILKG